MLKVRKSLYGKHFLHKHSLRILLGKIIFLEALIRGLLKCN